MSTSRNSRPRGFTLIEALVSMTITVTVIAGATQAMIALDRDQAYRHKLAVMQGAARETLDWAQADIRHGCLGVGSLGAIWMPFGAGSAPRSAMQIFANLGGPGGPVIRDAKAETDALLLVEAFDVDTSAATVQAMNATNWTGVVQVTSAAGFKKDDGVLMSNSFQASWGVLQVDPGPTTLTLASLVNVLPPAIGNKVGQPTVELKAGSTVRRARARLYYVDTNDELVRLTLSMPRAPGGADEILGREVLAQGVENMKVDCRMANGANLAPDLCPSASVTAGDPVQAEAVATFGPFSGNGGPLFTESRSGTGPSVSGVQSIVVSLSVRNTCPMNPTCTVDANQSDQRIPLRGAQGVVELGTLTGPTGGYARRAYRINAAVRNNTLGAL